MNKIRLTESFENDIFILNENNLKLNFNLNDNETKNLYFIDILETDLDFNLMVNLSSNNQVNCIFCSLNVKEYNKNINVYMNHNDNGSYSSCEVFSINKDFSKTNIDLSAVIEPKSLNNNCVQIIRGVLLSNNSKIKGKPNLFIDSNNIKAKHSLAIGALNKNHLFYLVSKGMSEENAKKLIIMGFFNKLISKINNEKERENLYNMIYKKIGEI